MKIKIKCKRCGTELLADKNSLGDDEKLCFKCWDADLFSASTLAEAHRRLSLLYNIKLIFKKVLNKIIN